MRNSFSSLSGVLYIPELRGIHHLCLQMLLDYFCQITPPCLLILFGNEWRTLLTIEGVPSEWLEVEMPEDMITDIESATFEI